MNLNGVMKFIYKNCSDRIAFRIRAKGLSHRSIYRADPKIIGRICRCKITKNRNTYLIQDCVRDELKAKLEFASYQEMLWGTTEEICEQLPALFLIILTDLANDDQYKDTTNHILCAHIPYARYYGYYKIIFMKEPLIPDIDNAYFYDIDKAEMLSSIDAVFSDAVNSLFEKCHDQFKEAYMHFVNTHNSFKRWNYRFEEWIKNELMPILLKYTPDENSFGMRILKMIETDFCKIPLLKITNEPDEIDAIKRLLSSTENYIISLEQIQSSYPYIQL